MNFVDVEPTLENYWRAIILFGRNTASYKFALAPCVRIVVTPNNQVKGGNKEQRCPVEVPADVLHMRSKISWSCTVCENALWREHNINK